MKLKVKVNMDGYVKSFCEIGFFAEGYTEIELPSEYVDAIVTLKNRDIISNKFEVSEFFKKNSSYFKVINGELVFDEGKKAESENLKKQKQIEALKENIMLLSQKKEFFEFKKWDITELNIEMENLENEIKKLEGE